jgi:hypothetical protein
MTEPELPYEFLNKCKAVTAKRPRTVIEHILQHGYITTEELKEKYGYNHPPIEISGDDEANRKDANSYMLLCGSANRAKSWSCEHCSNWREVKNPEICRKCYWAFPDNYDHIAMHQLRRTDIMWVGEEIAIYDALKKITIELQKDIPKYIKEIIEKHLGTTSP